MNRTIEFFNTNPNASLADAVPYVGKSKSTISGYLTELNGSVKR